MRRQDELLALYSGRDVYTRKYILSQAETLSQAFDSDELLEFLQGELGDADPVIRNQALFTLTRFFPGFIRKRYGLSANTMGVWSTYEQDRNSIQNLIEEAKGLTEATRRRRAAFLFRARGIAKALLGKTRSDGANLTSPSRLALAQYPLQSVARNLLESSVKGDQADFETILPFALVMEGDQNHRTLLEIITRNLQNQPDLVLLICTLPPELALEAIQRIADHTNTLGRMNAALALARIEGVDHRQAMKPLLQHGEGWVQIYTLRAMERLGDVSYLEDLVQVFERGHKEFIRVQAVRAAGGLGHPNAVEFCIRALGDRAEPVKAQALESLVRLSCPPDRLSQIAAPFLDSPSVRARVNAILATTSARDKLPAPLMELLLSNETIDRLEAAYCLGYLQNRKSLSYLATLLTYDPHPRVKFQAIKSLSKYPARHALPNLLPTLKSRDPREALTVARVLSRFESEEACAVIEVLAAETGRTKSAFHRALLYRTMGILAGRTGQDQALPALIEGLHDRDLKVVAGAIEGCNLQGGSVIRDQVRTLARLSSSGDRRVAPRALMGLVFAGRLEGLDGLAKIIAHHEGRQASPAVETALELGLLMADETLGLRYPALRDALDAEGEQESFQGFQASGEISLHGQSWTKPETEDGDDGRAEGEFKVTRSLRKDRRESAPTREEAFSEAVKVGARDDPGERAVRQLRQHLQDPRVRQEAKAPNFNERLRKLTYLVGERLETPDWLGTILRYRMLILPAGALSIVIGITVFALVRSSLGEPPPPPGASVSVEHVFGSVRMDGVAEDLRVGEEILPGSIVNTEPGEKVRFITRSGNRISMYDDSQVTFHTIEGESPSLGLEVRRGKYSFNCTSPGRIDIECGRFKISGEGMIFILKEYRSKFSLIVDAGKVLFEEKGQGAEDLGRGDLRVLE